MNEDVRVDNRYRRERRRPSCAFVTCLEFRYNVPSIAHECLLLFLRWHFANERSGDKNPNVPLVCSDFEMHRDYNSLVTRQKQLITRKNIPAVWRASSCSRHNDARGKTKIDTMPGELRMETITIKSGFSEKINIRIVVRRCCILVTHNVVVVAGCSTAGALSTEEIPPPTPTARLITLHDDLSKTTTSKCQRYNTFLPVVGNITITGST